jgi:hypothetical protein
MKRLHSARLVTQPFYGNFATLNLTTMNYSRSLPLIISPCNTSATLGRKRPLYNQYLLERRHVKHIAGKRWYGALRYGSIAVWLLLTSPGLSVR